MNEINFIFSHHRIFTNKGQEIDTSLYHQIKILTYICPIKSNIPITLYNLEELYYYQNINEIPNFLTNLKILYCNNTGIKSIPDTLTKLEYLDCSHNPELTEIPDTFNQLKKLRCKYTSITNLQKKYKNICNI